MTGGPPPPPEPVIDTRPYRRMIALIGLGLVIGVSIYQFASHGTASPGVPAGQRLHLFAAPLAASTLEGDANMNPPCTLARHDPRALNICLLVGRAPLVLALFVTGSGDCEREVDTLQALAQEFPPRDVQFAAVAIHTGHAAAARAVRTNRWTIPVAYDRDGAVGVVYDAEICPLVELVNRGGVVADLLIGDHWLSVAALGERVRALVDHGSA